ncbi:MAG TPA: helix-turn-helix domain-containing protein [Allosphingosinicella sp.]|jgi:transcriptional regulator with XRE-family HTH domain|nr:helix-turn-helix domain-containing protein [Allosphingosinicella sp.]
MAQQALGNQPPSMTVGERLQQAREARGLRLDDVANQTRIPIRHLQHIEREEWDALPAITYCIGFVRSYGNAIGLNGTELGREVRDRLGGTRPRAAAAEYYEPADPARVPPRSLALIAAGLAIALIIAYAIWRSSLDDVNEPSAPAPVPAATAPGAQPGAPPPQPPGPQAVAGQPVTLTATEEVWLRISDAAGGAALFEGTMSPGQRFQVPATAQRPVIRTARPQVLRLAIGARDIGPIEPVERTISNVSLRAEDLAARAQAGAGAPAQ